LASSENLPADQLEAIYILCWCADYHMKLQEFEYYVHLGNRLLQDHEQELKRIDSDGIHRASMIIASGLYYYALGDYDDAIAEYSRIITFNSIPLTRDSSILYSACAYLGQSWYNIGNLDKALQYFEMANKYIQKSDAGYNYTNAVNTMYQAECLSAAGLIQDAFNSYQQSLQMLKKEKDLTLVRNSLISNYSLIARCYLKMEQFDSALSNVNRAIDLHLKDDPNFPGTYRFEGEIFYSQQKFDSALACFYRSLDIYNSQYKGSHVEKSKSLTGIANVYRDLKQYDKAEPFYHESLKNLLTDTPFDNINQISADNLNTIVLPNKTLEVMLEQAKLFFLWYQTSKNPELLDSCIAILEKALLLNDISRRELTNIETKELRIQVQSQITDLGVDASYKAFELSQNQGYLMKAFDFMEKSKGNILMDQVNEVRAKKFSGIPEDLLQKEARLRGELSLNKDRLLKTKSSAKNYNQVKTQYNEKLREYMAMISALEEQYPRYYKLKYDPGKVQSEEIQKKLPSDFSLMIQYYIGGDKIYMAGITRNQVVIQATERDQAFDKNLKTLLNQLSNANIMEVENDPLLFKEFVKAARFLYLRLISPVLQAVQSPVKDMIIIPDGYLCYLPFEILLTGEYQSLETDYSLLPYLLRKYQIRYDYSASLLIENEDSHQKNWNSYIGYAPIFTNRDAESNIDVPVLKPGMLYANQDEVAACEHIWKGVSRIGNQATEESFRKLATKVNILHLATHTYLDDGDPRKSCFVFTTDKQSSEDGFLYTYELYSMNMLVRLAILSGCETGIGHIKKGEGIISLARAFKFAGCPNILMSLWKVNDQTTKDIMISFNKYLKKGMEKDRALQLAKINYLKGSKNLHPAFWSSFVLIGNEDPVKQSGKTIVYGLIACVIILALLAFLLRKKHPSSRFNP
jgi:CHAT domain-containing protein